MNMMELNNNQTINHPRKNFLRIAVISMYLIAAFWVLFAAHWFFRESDYRYFYAISGFSYAIVLAGLAFYLNKKQRWAWWGAIMFTGLNVILTLADQVGWFDLAYLIPSIAVFIIVLRSKKYLSQAPIID
ncbi:MAG: hypothetical protein WCV50_06060 [Patescibacteria group bacterium]|jgi:hypothetical protein